MSNMRRLQGRWATEQSERSEYDDHNSNNIDKDNINYNNTSNKKLIITAVKNAILQCQRMRNYLKNTRHRYHVHPTLAQRRQASRVHRESQQ